MRIVFEQNHVIRPPLVVAHFRIENTNYRAIKIYLCIGISDKHIGISIDKLWNVPNKFRCRSRVYTR